MRVPLGDQIICVKRELGFRERVYAKRVEMKVMTTQEAQRELTRMKAVLGTLEELLERQRRRLEITADQVPAKEG
jgi:hypothetical protein